MSRPCAVPFNDKPTMDFGRKVGNAAKASSKRASQEGWLTLLDDALGETRLTRGERRQLDELRARVLEGVTLTKADVVEIARLTVATSRRPTPTEAKRAALFSEMPRPLAPPGRAPNLVAKGRT